VFVAAGIGSWSDNRSRFAVFVFVVAGWLISLCLHEFSHAAVAYGGGDHSVAIKGYLSFDIRRYANPFFSFVLPALFVLIGGIGLPGGAVWIDKATLRTRLWRSVVSLAGPGANLLCALACVVPFAVGHPTAMVLGNHLSFWAGVAFLGLLQMYAVFLNLLPVPGLDGWGAAEPYLPPNIVETGRKISPFGIMIVFFIVLSSPAIGGHIRSLLDSAQQAFGVPTGLAAWGYHLMQFWSRN
jgi:Zn-dependent protease